MIRNRKLEFVFFVLSGRNMKKKQIKPKEIRSLFFRLENKSFYSMNSLEVCDVYMSNK